MKQIEDIKLSEAFLNLKKETIQKIIDEEQNNRKIAIAIAKNYDLEREVKWCIDYCGYTPLEALEEWDLI